MTTTALARYAGPGSWAGAEWAVNLACLLASRAGAPIHLHQGVTLDDAWHARRLRVRFEALTRDLRVSARSVRLPPASASASEAVHAFEGAGHARLDGTGRRGTVFVHARLILPSPRVGVVVEPCPDPIVPEDAGDLHLHLDASLSAAFFGQRLDLGQATGVPALSLLGPVHIPPFAQDPDLRRVTIVPGAGLPLQGSARRGRLVIFSRLRLPRIPEGTLAHHERLLRGLFGKLEALCDRTIHRTPDRMEHLL